MNNTETKNCHRYFFMFPYWLTCKYCNYVQKFLGRIKITYWKCDKCGEFND